MKQSIGKNDLSKILIFFQKFSIPYVIIVFSILILFSPVIILGKTFYWGLPSLQFIPWHDIAWDMISRGILPLWNPYNGMGAPLLANYQLALFYPPSWILFLFSAIGDTNLMAWGYSFLVVLHLIWAGLGFAKLMEKFKLSPLSQTLTGICFPLGGYLFARTNFFSIIWTAAWFPWIILGASHIITNINIKKNLFHKQFIYIVTSITMMLLAGHAQTAWYILQYTTIWILIGSWLRFGYKQALNNIFYFSFVLIIALGISAIQIIPTAEYLLNSYRATSVDYQTGLTYSFWPWQLLTFIFPNMFGNPSKGDYWGYAAYWEDAVYFGLLPFMISITTLRMFISKNIISNNDHNLKPEILTCWIMAFLGTLLALGRNSPIFLFLYKHIFTFNMFNAPSRYMIWTVFSLILLTGIGIDQIVKPKGKVLFWLRLSTVGALSICLGSIIASKIVEHISPTFVKATTVTGTFTFFSCLLLLLKPDKSLTKKNNYWNWSVIFLIIVDLFYINLNYLPYANKDLYITKNKPNIDRFDFNLMGEKRVYLKQDDDYWLRYSRFIRFQDFRPIENLENLHLVLLPNSNLFHQVKYINNFDPLLPERYFRLINYINDLNDDAIQPWLSIMDVGATEHLSPDNHSGVSFQLFTGSTRVSWIPCAIFTENEKESWDNLLNPIMTDRSNITKYLVVEVDNTFEGDNYCDAENIGEVKIIDDHINNISIASYSEMDGWVLISDTWYPGWKGRIDGLETQVYIGNYLFRAVKVPAGNHQITLTYKPQSFYTGLLISVVFGILMLVTGRYFYKGK